MPASILIVDDEHGIRESLGAFLREEGYEVDAVSSGEECLAALGHRRFDLVLMDVWLPQMDGLAALERDRSGGRDQQPRYQPKKRGFARPVGTPDRKQSAA